MENTVLSVVIPVYNEEAALPHFHLRLISVLDTLPDTYEILYVNDGSTDNSLSILHALQTDDPRIRIVDLSRNFGKEIALSAGLDHSQGDAVVIMDADLQHPPELLPTLIHTWRQGYDVVYAQRTQRLGEHWLKKLSAYLFYRLLKCLTQIHIPVDAGDFRLLSRRAVQALIQLREHHRYMKGLFAWIGYPQIAVPYQPAPRFAGHTKWNYYKLWNLAIEGITSFSTAPLKLATYFGCITATAAFLYASTIIYKTLVFGETVRGYPSLIVVVLFLGGIQLLTLGVIGEYLGRLFNESKQRPLYFVKTPPVHGSPSTPIRPQPPVHSQPSADWLHSYPREDSQ